MPNQQMVQIIAKSLREGLPHPGDRENHQPAQLFRIPGMNPQGVPRAVLDSMAKEAGLPTGDIATLVAEALVHLIETEGNSEIVDKSELTELRGNVNSGDEVDGGTDASGFAGEGPMDGPASGIRR